MIYRLSRQIFNNCVKDKKRLRALSLCIFFKSRHGASAIRKWSYEKLAKEAGISINTCKKYVKVLRESGMVTYEGSRRQAIRFGIIKSGWKRANIRLDKLEGLSFREIEKALRVIFVREVSSRKEYLRQQVNKLDDKDAKISKKEIRAIRNYGVKRGLIDKVNLKKIKDYQDNGISYEYICNKLHISHSTWSELIRFGEKHNIIKHERRFEVEEVNENIYSTLRVYKLYDDRYKHSFISNNYIITYLSNTYSII